ncbi:MAG: HDOD domain-containing protein [Pseudomonadota bacterium]
MQTTLSWMNAFELAQSANKLAPFPDIVCRMNDAIADGTSDAADIGNIILLDPSLTASLLRAANSPIYMRVKSVSNIDEAVTLLGMQEIRNLAFAVSAADTVKAFTNPIVSLEHVWKHSLYTAIIADSIDQGRTNSCGLSLFTAGLLHDIGQLLMFQQKPDLSWRVMEHALNHSDGRATYESERELFGFDHMAVGAELARLWNFPTEIGAAIAQHHLPFETDAVSDVAVIVHVANSVAVLAELDSSNIMDAPQIDARAFEHLGLQLDFVIESAANAREILPDMMGVFAL